MDISIVEIRENDNSFEARKKRRFNFCSFWARFVNFGYSFKRHL